MLNSLKRSSYLPGFILSRKPLVFAAYDSDFLDRIDEFDIALRSYGDSRRVILQLGWQHERGKALNKLLERVPYARSKVFDVFVLANTPVERDVISSHGIDVEFCHQNAFLDERRYPVLPFIKRVFDAVYVARITPFKRHYLASGVKNLYLIGSHHTYEEEYYEKTLALFPDAKKLTRVSSFMVGCHIQRARCGLCLSAEEGAMFVSMEYLLSGVPLVDTANIGGRDFVMPSFAVKRVADSPDAVFDGVSYWCENIPDAREVRFESLKLLLPHRECLVNLLSSFGVSEEDCVRYSKRFPHKLGLRTALDPITRLKHGIRKSYCSVH